MKALHALYVITLLALFAQPAVGADIASETDPDLFAFFRPVEARVLTQVDSELVVDQGTAAGIRPGDILTVVLGKAVVTHPRTGRQLDTKMEYGPFLVVRRVRSELSYCAPLGPSRLVSEGATVQRFGNVPIFIDDTTPFGYRMLSRLRERFPRLSWQSAPSISLDEQGLPEVFLQVEITPQSIVVRNQERQVLFAQPRDREGREGRALVTDPSRTSEAAGAGAVTDRNSVTEGLAGTIRPRKRFPLPTDGTLEAVGVMKDETDGRPEILLGIDGDLVVCRLDGERLREVDRYSGRRWKHILAISSLDLDSEAGHEIVVSALQENRVVSTFFRMTPTGRLERLSETHMALAIYVPPGGAPLLFGIESTDLLNRRPPFYRVSLETGRVFKAPLNPGPLRWPFGVTTIGAPGEDLLTVVLTVSGALRVVDRAGSERWMMSGSFGGSLFGIKVPLPGSRNTEDYDLHRFPGQLQRTSAGTLLVARHDEPGLFGNSAIYENGHLVEIAWEDGQLREIAESPNLHGMIVDFDQFDLDGDGVREIIAGLVYRPQGLFSSAISGLVVLKP